MAYEVPFYAKTRVLSTNYYDFESKTRITHEPSLVKELTVGILTRLQNGGIVECDESGDIIDSRARNQRGAQAQGNIQPVVRQLNPLQKQELVNEQVSAVVEPGADEQDEDEGPGLDDLLSAAESKTVTKGNTKKKAK